MTGAAPPALGAGPPLWWRRIVALAVDYALIGAYAGVVLLIGAALYAAGVTPGRQGAWLTHVLPVLLLSGPFTLVLAWWESRPRGGTPGKHLLGLRVRVVRGGRVPFGRAILRTALKLAVPWELGHALTFRMWAHGDVDRVSTVLLVLVYGLLGVYLIMSLSGTGRTPYDRAAGTVVEHHPCRRSR